MKILIELNKSDSKKYKVKAICNSMIYVSKSKDQLLDLYYLVLEKGFFDKKNTWEQILII